MGKISRRAVVAGAAGAAAAPHLSGAGALAQPPAQPPATGRIVVISDVHIGDGSPTVWYQQSLHEPFLAALLDYVAETADSVRELVILGDFVDFWTYPSSRRPPSFAEIARANPAILGPDGKLARAVAALKGRASYVPGNHDMGVAQGDLDAIAAGGPSIRLRPDTGYSPLGADPRILLAHGHRHTLFNAPDPGTKLAPLPCGHFVTRAISDHLARTLKPGQTAADLSGQGAPNGIDLKGLAGSVGPSVVGSGFDYLQKVTGFSWDEAVLLPSGQTTSFREAKAIYADRWSRWAAAVGGGLDGETETAKAALAEVDGTYLPWFAQRSALQAGAELVVFGHSHTPIGGLNGGFIDYANSGFECPSRPDIGKKHPTFLEIDLATLKPHLKQVVFSGGSGTIEDFTGAATDSIVYGPTADFSTYVEIDNRAGAADLVRVSTSAEHGRFVVEPPARISRGERARFWLQDRIGVHGSHGKAVYQAGDGRQVTLAFACPTGPSDNSASGAPLRTRSGAGAWGGPDEIARRGHPFYVTFTT
jgi:UDP-2,3-diacylglucosamine pyrophosphatase LpxH